MPQQNDLFGFTPAQASLFGAGDNRLQEAARSTTPDPAKVRVRLMAILEKARAASSMPWSDHDARVWQTVFPNMANWLPELEAEQLRLEFRHEMDRLTKAA
jgi:hypothetical protein